MAIATLSVNGAIDTYDYYDSVCLQGLKDALVTQAPFDSVTVFINSYGGVVTEGLAIYDWLRTLNVEVTTVVIGMCYSIAGPIFMAGKVRLISEYSELIIHPVSGYSEGTAEDMRAYAELMDNYGQKIIDLFANETGQTPEQIRGYMEGTTYLDSAQCVALGFATGIYTSATAKVDRHKQLVNVAKRKPKGVDSESQNKPKEMANEPKKLNPFAQALADFNKAVNKAFGAVKNADLTLKDGTGVYSDSADNSVSVGDTVYKDASMAETVADGTYTLADDSTFTTVGGVVTALAGNSANEDATNADTAKIAALEAKILELENGKTENTEAIAEMQNAVKDMATSMTKALGIKQSVDPDLTNKSGGSQKANPKSAKEEEKNAAERRADFEAKKEATKKK